MLWHNSPKTQKIVHMPYCVAQFLINVLHAIAYNRILSRGANFKEHASQCDTDGLSYLPTYIFMTRNARALARKCA
eukprot:5168759-Pleurochrysis_carterae.AAC.3